VTELQVKASVRSVAKTCATGGTRATTAATKKTRKRSKRVLGRLFGNGKGRFRTKGRYSAATVRGTIWLTEDRCDGTLTRVTKGVVQVRDFRAGRTINVRAGQSYLARADAAQIKLKKKRKSITK
jgi:hypothetical protein